MVTGEMGERCGIAEWNEHYCCFFPKPFSLLCAPIDGIVRFLYFTWKGWTEPFFTYDFILILPSPRIDVAGSSGNNIVVGQPRG